MWSKAVIKPTNWKTLKSEFVLQDKWIKVRADICELPSGRQLAPYYVIEYPTWLNVVAVTENDALDPSRSRFSMMM